MTGEDGYVFIVIEPFPDPGFALPWRPLHSPYANETVEGDVTPEEALKEAYRAVLMITMSLPDDGRLDDLMNDVTDIMMQPPYNIESPKPSIMSAYLYDAIHLYAHAANVSMATDDPPLDGGVMGKLMQGNVSFEGMTGTVKIDEMGSRMSDFNILDLQNNMQFEVVGNITRVNGMSFAATIHGAIDWPGMTQPLDAPDCGFNGEDCFDRGIIAAIVVAVIVTVSIIILVPVARLKYTKFIKGSDWLIDRAEITFIQTQSGAAFPSNYRLQNMSTALSKQSLLSTVSVKGKDVNKKGKNFSFATFNSHTVVLRKVQMHDFNLTKTIKRELKEMRWLVHDNINRFLGLCFPSTSGDTFYHVSEFSPKGSLKSILANDDVNLDLSFKASFIRDLARGMQFIHASEIKSHGLLSSSTCYVDSRWVLKISGFGLLSFNIRKEDVMKQKDPEVKFSKMLWTAPELLRGEMLPSKGSQKGDVYSYGIILQEIVTRSQPFYLSGYTSREIIRRVIRRDEPPCRPKINEDEFESSDMATIFTAIYDLMKMCWEELPEDRPDFTAIRTKLRGIQKGRKELDILDNMLSKMEKYTENLEKVVADRTGQLLEEKKKTDALLFRMLPQVVAEELKKGNQFPGEFFDHVTIYFSDVVGFTDLSAQSTPMQVVDLLNDLYTCFDAVLERFDVYKVETIGDAYMVVSGLPRRNGNRHAGEIACVALELLTGARTFRIRHKPDHQLQIRIGINTGPVAAGVVGLTMPRFCLFGDTVNTASRMESNSLPQKIHISTDTAAVLKEVGGYVMEKRGLINIKGKGQMTTYWLLGTDSSIRPHYSIDTAISKKISTDTMISQDSLLSPSHRMSDAYDIPEDRLVEEDMNKIDNQPRPSTIAEKRESTSPHMPVTGNTDDQFVSEADSRPISTGSWTDGGQGSMRFSRSVTPLKGIRAPVRLADEHPETIMDKYSAGSGVRPPFVTDDLPSAIGIETGEEGGYDNPVMDPRGTVIEEGEGTHCVTSPKHSLSPIPQGKSVSPSSEGNRRRRSLRSGTRTENNNYLSPAKRKTAITLHSSGSPSKASVSKA
nr:atrial natriuretic peptide receptor 1-like [Lytechinus pictus]